MNIIEYFYQTSIRYVFTDFNCGMMMTNYLSFNTFIYQPTIKLDQCHSL